MNREEIVNNILGGMPATSEVILDFPSEYKLYDKKEGEVTLRPMTFDDEKAIAVKKKEQNPINLLLQRCLTNINVNELLLFDKFYSILKLRELSYGDDYNVLLICQHCGAENDLTVKLSQLNVNPVPDEFEEPAKIILPVIKKEVLLRYPRVKDEAFLKDTTTALDNLWRFINSIDGNEDKSIIAEVINKLPLVDIKTLLKAINLPYGVDTRIKFKCEKCEGVSVTDLPIDTNFFDVN
jgi:hypothetical protein